MFETELLRSFVAVAELRGFTRAADRLNLTQSTISAQIRRLEAQAGCPLLARSTRSVALTDAGMTLLGYARSILHLNEDARAQLGGSALTGSLRIGASEDFAGTWLPDVLRRFAGRHPAVRFEVEVGIAATLFERMDDGRLDLALCSRCRGGDRGESLWYEPLAWASGQLEPLSLPDPLPLALFPEPCPYREAALAALARAGRRWHIVYVSPSLAGVRAAALAGLAITPLPRSALPPGLREWTGSGLPALPDAEFVVATAPGEVSEPARQLADSIRQTAASRLRWDSATPPDEPPVEIDLPLSA